MSKIAFLFPGQGVQKTGMGEDFYQHSETARQVFETASHLLQMDMKALCFQENEKLHQTEYTQAALVTTCLAMAETIFESGLRPQVTAGLSLGEYCAVCTAGGMELQDAIRTVRKRGIFMQNAVPPGEGAMAAVLGLSKEQMEAVLQEIEGVSIANYNCPGQLVITGRTESVQQAEERLKQVGAKRVVMLNVSGPFHSPFLESAENHLREELNHIEWYTLQIPYVTNVTAEYICDISQTKELLARQVTNPVRWQQSMERMIADGVDTFVEIGPGRTLTGFLKKINRGLRSYNIGTWEDMEKVVQELC